MPWLCPDPRLLGGHPAIHGVDGAGDEGGVVAGQEESDPGDVLGRPQTADGVLLDGQLEALLQITPAPLADHRLHQRCEYGPGTDAIDADAAGGASPDATR